MLLEVDACASDKLSSFEKSSLVNLAKSAFDQPLLILVMSVYQGAGENYEFLDKMSEEAMGKKLQEEIGANCEKSNDFCVGRAGGCREGEPERGAEGEYVGHFVSGGCRPSPGRAFLKYNHFAWGKKKALDEVRFVVLDLFFVFPWFWGPRVERVTK